MKPLEIFIGSSSEIREKGVLAELSRQLAGKRNERGESRYKVKRWDEIFGLGDLTIDTIVDVANEVDFAILIFGKDDTINIRDENYKITRDNVLLEYGLFLGLLSRNRVFVLGEEDTKTPTDLSGITLGSFSSNNLITDIEIFVGRVEAKSVLGKKDKKDIVPEESLTETYRAAQEMIALLENKFTSLSENPNFQLDIPFVIDSEKLAKKTYAEALNLVKKKFWTTTFLTSGFWTHNDAGIMQANRNLLQRIQPKKENAGEVRRLFLLTHSKDKEESDRKQQIITYRRQGKTEEINRIDREFNNLKQGMESLISDGCQVRIVYDSNRLYNNLPNVIRFDPSDSELAIYDDFRLDIFRGGSIGLITEVDVFTNSIQFFDAAIDGAKSYFENLWDTATPAMEFIHNLEKAHKQALRQIDYQPNWLARYEFALEPDDQELKTVEIKRVEEILRDKKMWGNIEFYLDVGTCTGRYPLSLREAVKDNGKIYGVDQDGDCIIFSKGQALQKANQDKRIVFKELDFCHSELFDIQDIKFNLITCMLGTISHFGWNKNDEHNDSLQQAIQNFYSTLSPDGLLIIANWSARAVNDKKMLNIYSRNDKNRLANWTPSSEELTLRLEEVGFTSVERIAPEQRLDLFICSQ